MIVNEHGNLVDTAMGGGGYHGRCQHCGLAFVTDLGYCSWEGTKCVDREVTYYGDIPNEITSYARFRGLNWDKNSLKFIKPYSEEEFTIDELNEIINGIHTQ